MSEWARFWADTPTVVVVGWVLGILGLLGFLAKSWPFVVKFVAWVNALLSLPAFIARTDATLAGQDLKIEEIHHEVNYNNGSSVKDKQTRTEEAVSRVEHGVRGLYSVLTKLTVNDPGLASELEQTRPRPETKEKS